MKLNWTKTALVAATLVAPTTLALADDSTQPATPKVGAVAPALGTVQWRQLPDGKRPVLTDLRGKVVVVQTWVWFCDP